MNIKLVGIDLAKHVYQLCAVNDRGRVIFNRQVRRARLLATVARLPQTVIAMEACGSAHYWGRAFQSLGHTVRVLPAQHVKPFVRVNKNDPQDALAICEAAQRPEIHDVPIKSLDQQDLQLVCRARDRLVRQRTATANQIRGFAREYGVFFPVGYRCLQKALPLALEDANNALTPVARQLLATLLDDLHQLSTRIQALQQQLLALTQASQASQKLQTVPGFGPVVAAALLGAVGNARQFKNGRQMAAWLGLVPRQYGSAGKTRLYGITKNGDRFLRTQLIHGARAVVTWADRRDDPLGHWVRQLKARRGTNRTVVALANKMARMAWVVLATDQTFDLNKAFA